MTDADRPSEEKRLACGEWRRSLAQSVTIWAFTLVEGTLSVLISLAVAIAPGGSAQVRAFGFVWVCVCAAIFAYGIRSAVCGIRICGPVVHIRNPLSSVRVEIANIEAVGRGRWSLFPKVGLLYLRDGNTQHIWGIQAPNLFGMSHTDQLLGRLAADLGVEHRLTSHSAIQ